MQRNLHILTVYCQPLHWWGDVLASHDSSHLYVLIPFQDCYNPYARARLENHELSPVEALQNIREALRSHKTTHHVYTIYTRYVHEGFISNNKR